MRLLANENIPLVSVMTLRETGHDVVSISERSPGIPDNDVMQIAHDENRIILTFDRDYGELIFRHQLPSPAGILYMRFLPASAREPADYLLRLIAGGVNLSGTFTTGDRQQIRQRPLPQ